MRLAIVVDFIAGGVGVALRDFLRCMEDRNIEVTVFVPNIALKQTSMPWYVKIKPWGKKKHILKTLKNEGPLQTLILLKNKFLVFFWTRNINRRKVYEARMFEAIEGEFDCAVAYHMTANNGLVVALEKINANRKILWVHDRKKYNEKDLRFFERIYSKADAIVCVSKELEARFTRLFPKCSGKTKTIHNCYDIERIKLLAMEPVADINTNQNITMLVTVGRLSKEKGIDRIVEVAEKLSLGGRKICWYIVGDGQLRSEMEKRITEKKLENIIKLLGYRANPYPYIRGCDIYVQPSYREGFCTTTMEAKILGKPVVATNISGMNEQFENGKNGIIVESSVDGIYNGIVKLMDNPQLMDQIINELSSEEFSNDAVLNQTLQVLHGNERKQ